MFFGSDIVDVLAYLLSDALLHFAILLQVLLGGLAKALLHEAHLSELLCQAGVHEIAIGFEVGKQLLFVGSERLNRLFMNFSF